MFAGSAQLDTEDLLASSTGYSRRLLQAYYSRNFGDNVGTCYRSSYFSPYRLYFINQDFDNDLNLAQIHFQLDVTACPVANAYCCSQKLDHFLLRTGKKYTQCLAAREHCNVL